MSALLTNMILSCGVTSSNTIANFVTTYPKHVKALKQTLASNVDSSNLRRNSLKYLMTSREFYTITNTSNED